MNSVKRKSSGVSIKVVGAVAAILFGLISVLLFGSLFSLSNRFNAVQESTKNYISWKQTVLDVKEASDYLTEQVRYYVFNHNKDHMDNYFYEANVTKRRENAIEVIEQHLPSTQVQAQLEAAVRRSKDLMKEEYYAMRLTVESLHIVMDDTYPVEIKETTLSEADMLLSDQEKRSLALEYVIGDNYLHDKEYIITNVDAAVSAIDTLMEQDVINSTEGLKQIVIIQEVLIGVNILIIGFAIFVFYVYTIKPLNHAVDHIKNQQAMEETGVKEFRYLSRVYNKIREQTLNTREKLVYEAEHDKLTGIYNRTGYDTIYRRAKLDKCYYILIDIDFFKEVNDAYGHETGDRVLIKVASTINKVFKEDNEFTFRIGGDEFSVLIENNDNISEEDVIKKCEQITKRVNTEGKQIPEITLSIGIAKGTETDTTDTLFKKADKALYKAKNTGRHNISVY